MTAEREIVFGQAFYPKGEEGQSLYVVTDTSPQHNPNTISAAHVVIT